MGKDGGTAEERFARRLRQLRKQRGWGLEHFAALAAAEGLRLHTTAYSKIELGQRVIRLNEAAVFAAVLGVPLGQLLISDDPSVVAGELEQVTAELAEAQTDSDDALTRAAALWNRKQELLAALGQERGGYSPDG